MNRYWQGETLRARVDFTDGNGGPLAAVGVVFTAKAPSGTRLTGDPVPMNVPGAWYADFALNEPGTWHVRASCSGPTPAADEDEFEVRASTVL